MNSKNFITVALFFFSSLYSLSAYSAMCEVRDKKTVIYYANGINNTALQAWSSVNAINSRFSSQLKILYPSEEFEFKPSFNQSIRFDKDIIETINQKATETGGLTAFELLQLAKLTKDAAVIYMEYINSAAARATLADPTSRPRTIAIDVAIKAFDKASDAIAEYYQNFAENEALAIEARTQDDHIERYRKNIQSGNRTIVVAHSQGNLFTNNAITIVRSEYPEDERSLVSLGVGTPASTLLPFSDYITNANDFVINLLRPLYDVLPATNFPTIDEIALIPSFSDFISHNFQASYFDENKAAGRAFNIKLLGLIRTSTFPCEEPVIPPPANLIANADDTSIELNWDNLPLNPSVTLGTYTVYVSINRLFTTETQGIEKFSNGLSNTFEYPNPIFGTNYFFGVTRTVNGVESALSEIMFATLTPPEQTELPAPTDITATLNEDNHIEVSWDNVDEAEGYTVYVRLNQNIVIGAGGVADFSDPDDSSPFLYRNANPGQTYYFAVTSTAEDGARESELSTQVSVSVPEISNPPESISAVGGEGSITVNWRAVTGASEYYLYTSLNSNIVIGGAEVRKESQGLSTFFSFETAVTDPFYFAVTSVVNGVESRLSTEVSASISEPEPEVPIFNSGVAITSITDGFQLAWNEAVGDVTKYELYRSTSSGTLGTLIYSTSNSPLMYTDTSGLVDGQRYYYQARACNGDVCTNGRQDFADYLEPVLTPVTVTPLVVTVGEDVIFTIKGTNLPTDVVVQLEENDNCTLQGEANPSEQEFLCENVQSTKDSLILTIGEFGGEGLEGSPFTLSVEGLDIKPDPPKNVEASGKADRIFVSWKGSQDDETYIVFRSENADFDKDGPGVTNYINATSPLTITDDLEVGTEYFFAVSALKEGFEESELSAKVSASLIEPIVKAVDVDPKVAKVGEYEEFDVEGENLDRVFAVSLEGTSNCRITSRTTNELIVGCTPEESGTKKLFIALESGGDPVEGSPFFIEVAPEDEVESVVTSIAPLIATVGEEVSFTLTGTDLPSTIAVSLEGTDNCEITSQSSTQVVVTCTPQTAGSQNLFVADAPGGTALEGTPKLVDVAEEVDGVITSVSPLEVTVGEDTLFTVVGTNFPESMVMQLEGNDNCTLQGEASPTEQTFLCADIQSDSETLTMAIGEFGGEELEGSPLTITVKGLEIDLEPPVALSAIRGESFGLPSVSLAWMNVETADGYNIYYSINPDFTIDSLDVTRIFVDPEEGGFSSLIVAPVDERELYFAITSVVDAGNNQVESELSEITNVPALETNIDLEPPENVVAVIENEVIKVSWDETEGADSYNIYVSNQPIIEIGVSGVTQYTSDSRLFSITDVQIDATYYIRVSASKDSLESNLSEETTLSFITRVIHANEDFESYSVGSYSTIAADDQSFSNIKIITVENNNKLLGDGIGIASTKLLAVQNYLSEKRYVKIQFDVNLQDELAPSIILGESAAKIEISTITSTSNGILGENLISMNIQHVDTRNPKTDYIFSIENSNIDADSMRIDGEELNINFEYYPSSGVYSFLLNQEVFSSGITAATELVDSIDNSLQLRLIFRKKADIDFIVDNYVITSEPN